MIALLRRVFAPAPPPHPWAGLEAELARLEPEWKRLRDDMKEAEMALGRADTEARLARDAAAAADHAERPAAERAYRAAMAARERAGKRYNDLRRRWPGVSSRRRQLRERVRVLRLLDS